MKEGLNHIEVNPNQNDKYIYIYIYIYNLFIYKINWVANQGENHHIGRNRHLTKPKNMKYIQRSSGKKSIIMLLTDNVMSVNL